MRFAQRFLAWKWLQSGGQYQRVPDRIFASALDDRSIFRFHINALADFKQLMADCHLDASLVDWVVARDYEPFKYDFKVLEKWNDLDYQVPYIDYLAQPKPIAKILEFQTGKGKSYSAMKAIFRVGERVVGVLKPKYLEKWEEDFRKTYEGFVDEKGEPVPGKILTIQGSKELKLLLLEAAQGTLDYPVILISNATYRNWLTEYERDGLETLNSYACLPEDFFLHLRAGIRLVDEGHEDFHLCFKMDTYTHVRSSITLTATLIHKDPLLQRMYDVQFPPAQRMKKLDLDRYADVINLLYRFKAPDKIRTEEYGQSTYSHNALEESVLRHVPTMRNYFALIKTALDEFFLKDRKPGEKALVYAYSIKMCNALTKYLQEQYPQLDVRRYVAKENDPYENLMNAELCVSTLGRAGTAHDIADLAFVLLTTALESVQGNIQALGRLRKRDGKMLFAFLTAEDIPKHVRYAEAKKILFQDRAASYRDISSGHTV
jgi:hypothetical protein